MGKERVSNSCLKKISKKCLPFIQSSNKTGEPKPKKRTADDADYADKQKIVLTIGQQLSVSSVNGAEGISDIEGEAATGSGERAGKRASFKSVVL